MPDQKLEVLRIYRLLSRENREELLTWVHLAYTAENSARKSSGFDFMIDGMPSQEPQDNPCKKSMKRRKK